MRQGTRSCIKALVLFGLLATATRASATVVTQSLYELGDNDPGAVSGLPGNATTIDAQSSNTLARGSTATPWYTNNTVALGSKLAMDFQANGGYAVSPVFNTLDNNFGIEAWVQADITTGTRLVAYNGNSGGSGWGIYQFGGVYQVLFGNRAIFGSTPVVAGQWTHLAVVRDNGTATLYANGVAAGTTSSTAPVTPLGSFLIGSNSGAENFDGRIDRVRVFTFTAGQFNAQSDLLLQSVQVKARYQLGEHDPGAAAGLPGNAVTVDDTGTLNLAKTGNLTYTSDTPGPGSQLAMDFGGAGGKTYLNSPVPTTAQKNWILEAWANADSTSGNVLLAYNGNTGSSGYGIYRLGDHWGILFGGVVLAPFNATVELNKWTHLALVRDETTTWLYVNGVPGSDSFTQTPNTPSGSFMIGGASGGGESFLGQIDDVRLSLFTGQFDVSMLGMNAALVPEPSSMALAGMGLLGLAALGCRWRRRAGRTT